MPIKITYADHMPGDSSDEDSPHRPVQALANRDRRISAGTSLSQTHPELGGSAPATAPDIRASVTLDGLPSQRRGLLSNLIDASLSVHDVSIYSSILASSDALPTGRLQLPWSAIAAHLSPAHQPKYPEPLPPLRP